MNGKRILTTGSILSLILIGATLSINTTTKSVEAIDNAIEQRNSSRTLITEEDLDTTGELSEGSYEDIMFFSSDNYKTNGFDRAAYKSLVAFANAKGQDPSSYSAKITSKYDDTGENYKSEILDLYHSGVKTIITSGFQVANTFMGSDYSNVTFVDYEGIWGTPNEDGSVNGFEDNYIILLDDGLLGQTYKNAISVQFAAEGAGYLAGYIASLYTIADSIVNEKTPNIVMWGGSNFPTVYSYMSGFAQAITEVNESTFYESFGLEDIILWSGGDFSDRKISNANSYSTSDVLDATTWYTFGFNGPDGTQNAKIAKQKTKNALDAGASVIFPIAGGNIAIVLDAISQSKSTTTKAIGVDTDATIDFESTSQYLLGSATKSLTLSGAIALGSLDDDLKPVVADTMSAWAEVSPDNKGIVMTGTLLNHGVGFTFYNENKSADGGPGMNEDLLNALMFLSTESTLIDEINNEDEGVAFINELFDSLRGNAIESSDAKFLNVPQKEVNKLWLWIILIIMILIPIILIPPYLLLKD